MLVSFSFSLLALLSPSLSSSYLNPSFPLSYFTLSLYALLYRGSSDIISKISLFLIKS